MDHMTRIFYVHDLLTPEECDHLIGLARAEFAPSQVGAPLPGTAARHAYLTLASALQCRRTRT